MAQSSTEVNRIRQQITQLTDIYAALGGTLQRYGDFGEAFYTEYLGTDEAPTGDITPTEFHDAITTLAVIVGGLSQAQRQAIIKLRI